MEIKPIAHIYTPFKEKFGIPRQSGKVAVQGKIVFEKEYRNPDALRGIEGFSHLWLVFDFSEAHREEWSATVRPPRLGGNRKMGVFATRSPFRPNSLGLSCVRLINTEETTQGTVLVVEGADLMDGTPIYDIKPYLKSDCVENAICGFSDECDNHFLTVENTQVLSELSEDEQKNILGCIEQDPRPSYRNDDRIYGMKYGEFNVRFTVENGVATLVDCIRVKN